MSQLRRIITLRETQGMSSTTATSRADKRQTNLAQLSLFDAQLDSAPPAANDAVSAVEAHSSASPADVEQALPQCLTASRSRTARQASQAMSRVLTQAEMPSYPPEAVEAATMVLKQLPQTQLWFTYKDIQFFFGVSRATVARRLREGLVPGVRMAGSSVIEDSPVQRFDRDQLKWLLLALRHRARQLTC